MLGICGSTILYRMGHEVTLRLSRAYCTMCVCAVGAMMVRVLLILALCVMVTMAR